MQGVGAKGIFYLREIVEADALVSTIQSKPKGTNVIVGGEYICLELAAVLKINKYKVKMVYPQPWCSKFF